MIYEQICRLMEVMPDRVVVIREDGTIALASSQAATLLGYGFEAFVGKSDVLKLLLERLTKWRRPSLPS